MQVRIDTSRAQASVDNIAVRARAIMEDSEHLLKRVRAIGWGMQTQMSDTVRKETKNVEEDLSNLRNEMNKLEAYMRELSAYISEYNRCGYAGSVLTYHHADVDTYDINTYLNRTRDVASSTSSFGYAFEDDYRNISSQLDSGIYRLDDNHAQCAGAMSSLKDKIYSAEHRLQEYQAKLAALDQKRVDLEARIRAALEKASAARANADAVYVPPYHWWTDSDGVRHDNSAERAAAISRRDRYLAEAARYEAEAARLQTELNQVLREIAEVKEYISYLQGLLAQMRSTEIELSAHLNELEKSRSALYQCRESLKSLCDKCMAQCHALSRNCSNAENNLVQAISALNKYEMTVLSNPQIQEWRLF